MLVRHEGTLDVAATLGVQRHGGRDPSFRLTRDGVWWATRTSDGPATLELHVRTDGVAARAWGPGSDRVLERVPGLLGADDSTDGFVPRHPAVADAHHRRPGLRIGRSGAVVATLMAAILAQRVTSVEAARQWRSLCHLFGGPAPGHFGLRLPPDPAAIADLPYWRLHRLSIERRRADCLRRVAAHADVLDATALLPLAEARTRLGAVVGVGPWTVAETAGPALGDADAVPVGDFHLPHLVAWALEGQRRGDDDRMLELLEPYRGHRGRVLRLLALDGAMPPRRAPRRAIPPIHAW